jgi:Ca2+-binding RTX toxin-like protein
MSTVTGNNTSEYLPGSNNADAISGNGGDDTLEGFNGNDIINGGTGNDWLYGQGDDDYLVGVDASGSGQGNDYIDGGTGYDTVSYRGAASGVFVSLDQGKAFGGADVGTDTLAGLDNILGSEFSDTLVGTYWTIFAGHGENSIKGGGGGDNIQGLSGNDMLEGGSGNDTIDGGADQDAINGGSGVDLLTGGSGNDTFVFGGSFDFPDSGVGTGKRDIITDFQHGIDKIDVSQIDADALNASGNQAFSFVGFNNPTAVAQIWATYEGNDTILHFETAPSHGGPFPDLEIQLSGHVGLSTSDFIL